MEQFRGTKAGPSSRRTVAGADLGPAGLLGGPAAGGAAVRWLSFVGSGVVPLGVGVLPLALECGRTCVPPRHDYVSTAENRKDPRGPPK